MDDGAKTFHCTVNGCTGAFGSEAGLKAHTLRHTSSFPCGRCEKTFNAKSDLERHVAAIHEHLHFQCDEPGCRRADKPFSRLDSLQRHLHKVHGKRPGVDDAFSPVPVVPGGPRRSLPPSPLLPGPVAAPAYTPASASTAMPRPAKRRLVDADLSDPGTATPRTVVATTTTTTTTTPEPAVALADRTTTTAVVTPSSRSEGGSSSNRERQLAQRVERLEADLAEMKDRQLELMASHAEELRGVRASHDKEMSEQRAMSRDLMDLIKTMSKDKA